MSILMLDLAGLVLQPEDKDLIKHPLVGGIILFKRNYESPEQLIALVASLRALKPSLLLAVDQEGGSVQRFLNGFTRLPAARQFGRHYIDDPAGALAAALLGGWTMAAELLAVGIDISFAPVCDIDNECSQIIADRAFASDPKHVAELTYAFIQGMNRAGMQATAKHFPGHGCVQADSHTAIPVDPRPYAALVESDIQPFAYLIKRGIRGIMPGHVIYSQMDSQPAGFSSYWLQQVLRKQLNFKGAIFSDDLTMEGASVAGDFIARAGRAMEAGCDMLLICNHRTAAIQVIENLNYEVKSFILSEQRISKMRGHFRYNYQQLRYLPEWQQAVASIEKFNRYYLGKTANE